MYPSATNGVTWQITGWAFGEGEWNDGIVENWITGSLILRFSSALPIFPIIGKIPSNP